MPTSRWILLWALSMAPVSLAWSLLQAWRHPMAVIGYLAAGWFLLLIFSGILGLIQSRLIARYRKPLPRWLPAYVGGSALGWVLGQVAFISLRRSGASVEPLVYVIVFSTTASLGLAFALAWAIWGRRWPPVWPLWVAGLLLLRTGPALAFYGLRASTLTQNTGANVAWAIAHGMILNAGMAWLLDRLAFFGDKEAA